MSRLRISPDWSPQARSVWGKTDAELGEWLPLVLHAEDSARVMEKLWHNSPSRVRQNFLEHFGSEPASTAFLCFLAGTHDAGKASSFQLKAMSRGGSDTLPDFVDSLRSAGVTLDPRGDKNARHAAIGQVAMREWLINRYEFKPREANRFAGIVGGHHGANPTAQELGKLRDSTVYWDSDSLRAVRVEIFEQMAGFTGASTHLPEWRHMRLPLALQMLATGMVIQADWIASNADLFPLIDGRDGHSRAEAAWSDLALPLPWSPTSTSTDPSTIFAERFPGLKGLQPNPVQLAMAEAAQAMATPGLLILESPMGSGKTEGAFMAAEVLASKFGCNGLYVGLPTMATANPMFNRVNAWLQAVPTDSPTSINLAHGKAALQEDFRALMSASRLSSIHDDSDMSLEDSQTIVHQWTTGRKKTLLAQHVVGTIDQLLFAALQSKHVVLRHLGLAGKVVIVDECHAADHFMRVFLKRALHWLAVYRVPVILMSATLPSSQRQEYLDAYAQGLGSGTVALQASSEITYPRITSVSAELDEVFPEWSAPEVQVRFSLSDSDAGIVEQVSERLADGGCIAVIRNTVASAQETFLQLRDALVDTEIVLLHSRFVAPHRMAREADLVSRLGRSGNRPARLVVVGTQVLEQSLDVDFDFMISDIAPIDLLMQRVGRLHRHARDGRPERFRKPQLVITGVDWDGDQPVFDTGSKTIYGESTLFRTLSALFPTGGHETVATLPQDIARLVELGYSEDIRMPEAWSGRFESASLKDQSRILSSISRAEAFVLMDPSERSDLDGLISQVGSDPEDPKGFARVRDSEDSLEVILLHKDAGTVTLPSGVGRFAGRVVPTRIEASDHELARAMAACTVPLPQSLTGTWIIDEVIAELEQQHDLSGWQESPWLRGQLCLFVNEEGAAELSVSAVSYGQDVGLIVEKPAK